MCLMQSDLNTHILQKMHEYHQLSKSIIQLILINDVTFSQSRYEPSPILNVSNGQIKGVHIFIVTLQIFV